MIKLIFEPEQLPDLSLLEKETGTFISDSTLCITENIPVQIDTIKPLLITGIGAPFSCTLHWLIWKIFCWTLKLEERRQIIFFKKSEIVPNFLDQFERDKTFIGSTLVFLDGLEGISQKNISGLMEKTASIFRAEIVVGYFRSVYGAAVPVSLMEGSNCFIPGIISPLLSGQFSNSVRPDSFILTPKGRQMLRKDMDHAHYFVDALNASSVSVEFLSLFRKHNLDLDGYPKPLFRYQWENLIDLCSTPLPGFDELAATNFLIYLSNDLWSIAHPGLISSQTINELSRLNTQVHTNVMTVSGKIKHELISRNSDFYSDRGTDPKLTDSHNKQRLSRMYHLTSTSISLGLTCVDQPENHAERAGYALGFLTYYGNIKNRPEDEIDAFFEMILQCPNDCLFELLDHSFEIPTEAFKIFQEKISFRLPEMSQSELEKLACKAIAHNPSLAREFGYSLQTYHYADSEFILNVAYNSCDSAYSFWHFAHALKTGLPEDEFFVSGIEWLILFLKDIRMSQLFDPRLLNKLLDDETMNNDKLLPFSITGLLFLEMLNHDEQDFSWSTDISTAREAARYGISICRILNGMQKMPDETLVAGIWPELLATMSRVRNFSFKINGIESLDEESFLLALSFSYAFLVNKFWSMPWFEDFLRIRLESAVPTELILIVKSGLDFPIIQPSGDSPFSLFIDEFLKILAVRKNKDLLRSENENLYKNEWRQFHNQRDNFNNNFFDSHAIYLSCDYIEVILERVKWYYQVADWDSANKWLDLIQSAWEIPPIDPEINVEKMYQYVLEANLLKLEIEIRTQEFFISDISALTNFSLEHEISGELKDRLEWFQLAAEAFNGNQEVRNSLSREAIALTENLKWSLATISSEDNLLWPIALVHRANCMNNPIEGLENLLKIYPPDMEAGRDCRLLSCCLITMSDRNIVDENQERSFSNQQWSKIYKKGINPFSTLQLIREVIEVEGLTSSSLLAMAHLTISSNNAKIGQEFSHGLDNIYHTLLPNEAEMILFAQAACIAGHQILAIELVRDCSLIARQQINARIKSAWRESETLTIPNGKDFANYHLSSPLSTKYDPDVLACFQIPGEDIILSHTAFQVLINDEFKLIFWLGKQLLHWIESHRVLYTEHIWYIFQAANSIGGQKNPKEIIILGFELLDYYVKTARSDVFPRYFEHIFRIASSLANDYPKEVFQESVTCARLCLEMGLLEHSKILYDLAIKINDKNESSDEFIAYTGPAAGDLIAIQAEYEQNIDLLENAIIKWEHASMLIDKSLSINTLEFDFIPVNGQSAQRMQSEIALRIANGRRQLKKR
jgi:hypothetical protein